MLIFDDAYTLNTSLIPYIAPALPARSLLLNIETTGLSPHTSFIYMIGMAWQTSDGCDTWNFRCLLVQSRRDEYLLLNYLYQLLHELHEFSTNDRNFEHIITCGGHSFSIHFIEERWANYSNTENSDLFADCIHVDIQKELAPYKDFFHFDNMKKATLEAFIGYERHADLSAKKMIALYEDWERSHDDSLQLHFLTHHQEDMTALIHLLQLRSYVQFWNGLFKSPCTWHLTEYSPDSDDENNVSVCYNPTQTCLFYVPLILPIPKPLSYQIGDIHVKLDTHQACLQVPLFNGRLKYFLSVPVKDYYYLPTEDQAIHRSVARFVDKKHRQKATPETCYTTRSGLFLPTTDSELTPYFQKEYRSFPPYILFDPEAWEKEPITLNAYLQSCVAKKR